MTTSTPTSNVPNSNTHPAAPTSNSTLSGTPVATQPSNLAFTGANAFWIILLGVALAAVAVTLLMLDRRSRKNR